MVECFQKKGVKMETQFQVDLPTILWREKFLIDVKRKGLVN